MQAKNRTFDKAKSKKQAAKSNYSFILSNLYFVLFVMTSSPNFWIEWLDSADIRQDANKVSEEAVKRVQEQGKKAKQAQQDIKKDKDQNEHLAKFLSFLLKNTKHEKIIPLLYDTFFKVKHPQSNIVYLRKNINSKVIVGIFVPFYGEQSREYKIHTLYESILPSQSIQNIAQLVEYLKRLSSLYHDNIPLDKDNLTKFLTELALLYIPAYIDKDLIERKQLIQADIAKYLYTKQ